MSCVDVDQQNARIRGELSRGIVVEYVLLVALSGYLSFVGRFVWQVIFGTSRQALHRDTRQ